MEEFGDPWSNVGETDSNNDFQPNKKKAKISERVKPAGTSRFGVPTTSDQLEKLVKGIAPNNNGIHKKTIQSRTGHKRCRGSEGL